MKIVNSPEVDILAGATNKDVERISTKKNGQLFASLLEKAGVQENKTLQPENVAARAQLALLRTALTFMKQDEQAEESDDTELLPGLTTSPVFPAGYSSKPVTDTKSATKSAQQTAALPQQEQSLGQIINAAGRRYALDPSLITAVIKTESGFDSKAVSPAGAEGLMQLMPATARSLGVKNSFDAQENIMAGSRYLARLMDKYDGDLDKALAAYNWGEGNVDRKGLDRLPQETQKYLAKVRSYYEQSAAGVSRNLA